LPENTAAINNKIACNLALNFIFTVPRLNQESGRYASAPQRSICAGRLHEQNGGDTMAIDSTSTIIPNIRLLPMQMALI
jgi:hypothetical protein